MMTLIWFCVTIVAFQFIRVPFGFPYNWDMAIGIIIGACAWELSLRWGLRK